MIRQTQQLGKQTVNPCKLYVHALKFFAAQNRHPPTFPHLGPHQRPIQDLEAGKLTRKFQEGEPRSRQPVWTTHEQSKAIQCNQRRYLQQPTERSSAGEVLSNNLRVTQSTEAAEMAHFQITAEEPAAAESELQSRGARSSNISSNYVPNNMCIPKLSLEESNTNQIVTSKSTLQAAQSHKTNYKLPINDHITTKSPISNLSKPPWNENCVVNTMFFLQLTCRHMDIVYNHLMTFAAHIEQQIVVTSMTENNPPAPTICHVKQSSTRVDSYSRRQ